MKRSVRDKLEGTFHKVKGALKARAGKLVADRDLEAEGNVEKAAGTVQRVVGKVEDVVGE